MKYSLQARNTLNYNTRNLYVDDGKMRCMNHSVHFYCLSGIPCFFFMQQGNAPHLDTAPYLLCTGKPSTQIMGFLLLFVARDADVHYLLSAAFGFPVIIK